MYIVSSGAPNVPKNPFESHENKALEDRESQVLKSPNKTFTKSCICVMGPLSSSLANVIFGV